MRQVYVWVLWLGVQGAGVLHSRMQLPSDCKCRCHEHRVEVPPHPLWPQTELLAHCTDRRDATCTRPTESLGEVSAAAADFARRLRRDLRGTCFALFCNMQY